MFLQQLKENIKINSKPYAVLRNEVVSYLLSHEDDIITNETILNILEKSVAYNAARYDIQNRFLSFGINCDMDEALFTLLNCNPDLVDELHSLMPAKLDSKIAALAYKHILGTVQSSLKSYTVPLDQATNAFNEAQEFLSKHQNMSALAVHFKCTKRLGSLIERLCVIHKK